MRSFVKDPYVLEFVGLPPYPDHKVSGEPFWTLKKTQAWKARTSWSVSALKTDFEYAEMEQGLFDLIIDGAERKKIYALLTGML